MGARESWYDNEPGTVDATVNFLVRNSAAAQYFEAHKHDPKWNADMYRDLIRYARMNDQEDLVQQLCDKCHEGVYCYTLRTQDFHSLPAPAPYLALTDGPIVEEME